jgi:hypothetical protein
MIWGVILSDERSEESKEPFARPNNFGAVYKTDFLQG